MTFSVLGTVVNTLTINSFKSKELYKVPYIHIICKESEAQKI